MSLAKASVSSSRVARIPLQTDLGVMVPAFFSMLVLQIFRAEQHRWLPGIWIETALLIAFPFVFYAVAQIWLRRHDQPFSSKSRLYVLQAGALVYLLIVIATQFLGRALGIGDANEIFALLILQYAGWYLAVFSKVPGFERASLVLCGSIVFVICCMTERIQIYILAGTYAVMSLWWLCGMYWNRLDSKAIDGNSKVLPIRFVMIGAAVLLMGGIAVAVVQLPGLDNQKNARGWSPFSGGEKGSQDEYARDGFGDGNLLAAGNNATTTGAVDSDQFIEDHKRSLYDVSLERYDGPVFKRPRNRSIALDKVSKHLHDVKVSEQAGRKFRTMRDSEEVADKELEDKTTEALFFVEGSLPARFAVDTFHHFDGWDWTKSPDETTRVKPRIQAQRGGGSNYFAMTLVGGSTLAAGSTYFQLCQVKPDFLTTRREHRVKLMRLNSYHIPSPAFLDRWRIAYVENPELFRWSDAGLIRMDGDFIATHTMIDLESFVPNFHVLKRGHDKAKSGPAHISDSAYLQVPANQTQEKIDELALKWTQGIQPGWRQVEAIVARLRSEFEFDPHWRVEETAEDSVGEFLEQGGGPSYMFATTCAMLLRSAGYRTRLTSGFLVQKKDYDWSTRQSIVTPDNLHMWPEVCLRGDFWIPVEPTPGYPMPYSTQTLWQWLSAKITGIIAWVGQHPIVSLLFTTAMCGAFVFRRTVFAFLWLCWWHLVRLVWPSGLLKTTRQLIDARFWVSGNRRPRSQTIRAWYTQVEPGLSTEFFDLWNVKNYCTVQPSLSNTELISKCREPIQALTLQKIKESIKRKMDHDDSGND